MTNVTDGANEILSFLGHDLALTDGNSVAGVTVSIVGTTATVTFPGAADAAALQALIDGLTYRNASENPTEADRVITITRLVELEANGDDTAVLNIASTVHVAPANDAAIISGDTAGESTEADSGQQRHTGRDRQPQFHRCRRCRTTRGRRWRPAPRPPRLRHLSVAANGVWTYTLDNNNAAVQALNAGEQR